MAKTCAICGATIILFAESNSFAIVLVSNVSGDISVIKNNQELTRIKIRDGKEKEYIVRAHDDINIYLPNAYTNDLKINYEGINTIDRTIPYNSKLGEIKVLHGNNVIYQEDVYLEEEVKYSNRKAEMSILIFTSLTFGFFDILLIIRKHYE